MREMDTFDLDTYERNRQRNGSQGKGEKIVELRYKKDALTSTDSDVTVFCKMAGTFIKDKELFRNVLDFIQFVSEQKLSKQCNIAVRKIDEYWSVVEQYVDMEKDDVLDDTYRYTTFRDENTVAAIGTVLWNEGSGVLSMGFDLSVKVKTDNSVILNALEDREKLVTDIVAMKYKNLVPVIDAVLGCIPGTISRGLKTADERRDYVFGMVDKFIEGEEFGIQFDSGKMTSLTQPGVALPHTLSPKDWLLESVSALLKMEFGSGLLVMARSKGVSDVRKYNHLVDSHLVFSDDETSALHWTVTPALYCNEMIDGENGLPVWKWRHLQKAITAEVASVCLTRGDLSSTARETARKMIAYEHAEVIRGRSGLSEIEWLVDRPYLARLGSDWKSKLGVGWVVKLWKRGYSKPQELVDHPDYLHVVSLNNAHAMQDDGVVLLQLSDQVSVLVIPRELWEMSKFVQNSKKVTGYISRFALQKTPSIDNPYGAFYVFYSLACTKQMLDAWQQGETFDVPGYLSKFMAFLSERGRFSQLLKTNSINHQKKLMVVKSILRPFPGPVVGLAVAPESTRFGKNSVGVYTKHSGYDKQIDGYFLDYDAQDLDQEYLSEWFDEMVSKDKKKFGGEKIEDMDESSGTQTFKDIDDNE